MNMHLRRKFVRSAWISSIALLLASLPMHPTGADEGRVCLLPFQSSKTLLQEGALLTEEIRKACGGGGSCIVPSIHQHPQYPPPNNRLSTAVLKQYLSIAEKNGCSHILLGRITNAGRKGRIVESKLFSSASKGIILNYRDTIEAGSDITSPAKYILRRAELVIENRFPSASDLTASRGTVNRAIRLKWSGTIRGVRYSIYRSIRREGPLELLKTTDETDFTDTTADEGLKYYYRVIPAVGDIKGTGITTWGYIKPKNPPSLTPNEIVDQKVRGKEIPLTAADAARIKRDLKLFEEYYESYFMITFIYLVGKMYVNRGELIVYRDFNRYTLDRRNTTVYFHKQDCTVKLLSERFFRFVRDMGWQQIPEREIMPRVVQNGIAFCIRTGEAESVGADGITRFIPTFEAVGFSTEYYRDFRDWKSNTIVFASSDKELDRKIKEAKSRGY